MEQTKIIVPFTMILQYKIETMTLEEQDRFFMSHVLEYNGKLYGRDYDRTISEKRQDEKSQREII
jgi:hypothetical protein